ncbi:toxin-antitoxin system YwqK family antitoxin [Aquimarina sp. AU474]|uniref:toxin-antitoxin system YwqK family antitoxin n=1 Tax=Aquimarina sp. AU474 TaxID=2108529 RepID=UPI000D691053|nr:hypothetical protein [Aquimarina sp. AU474]
MRVIFLIILALVITSCKTDISSKENSIIEADSIYVESYVDGKDKIVSEIENGFFHGLYHSYYKNGNIESSGVMIKGKKFGIWKFYNKSSELVRISKYIEDSVQFDFDEGDFPTRKFDFSSLKTSIIIPNSWKEIAHANKQKPLLELEQKCSNSSGICPKIIVTREKTNDVNFLDYINQNLALPENNLSGFIKVDEKQFEINGLKAFRLQYKTVINGVTIAGAINFIEKAKGDVYMIFVRAENSEANKDYLKYRLLFNDIVNSFK